MLDDLESNIIKEEKSESTSNKFPLSRFSLPVSQQNVNILSMSTSKRFIYLVTDRSELLRIESESLKLLQQAFNIDPPQTPPKFYENLTKIWTDREGNHSIIRYNKGIYYFNSSGSFVKELKSLYGIEVCAVGFDDSNKDTKSTGNFLVTDYLNNIYECNITTDKYESNGDFKIKDNAERLVTLSFKDSENEDDDDYYNDPRKKSYDRIYGIKFFRATKINLEKNENECYIIAVTKNKIYQFTGPGLTSFRQIMARFERNPLLFNDSCKYFPQAVQAGRRKGDFTGTDLDIIFKTENRNIGEKQTKYFDVFDQFGWKTESGYCFSQFEYDNNEKSTGLPNELKNFTVIPFAKIIKDEKENKAQKETGIEPKNIVQTNNHIFLLYNDCISVISKLTSNIVHTQYGQNEYNQMLYHEFGKDNKIILISSKSGLYQISLKDENNDIWKDYLEIGNYENAQKFCDSDKLKLKINKIDAEYEFDEKQSGEKAAEKFANSDEKFEIVCLKYLMRNDLKGLSKYLQKYMDINLYREEKNKKKDGKKEENNQQDKKNVKKVEDTLQLNLVCTWILEIFVNQIKDKKEVRIDLFRELVRSNIKYLQPSLIYQLLQSYGRTDEFIEFASLMGDFEKVILYFINQGEISTAIDKLTWFASFSEDQPTIQKLTDIFLENCHIFFKNNPKESISLLQQRFKEVKMERIVQAIMSTTDKDNNDEFSNNKVDKQKMENSQAILSYLKSLIERPKIEEEEESNIHNLYIYYLSRNKTNQEAILEYLKGPLRNDENDYNYYHKKKEALFQLDYAKKLFKNNPPAYALVLALMQKHSEGVRTALMQKTDECTQIAKFIASNAPGEKLRKKLWIDIFSCDNQNEFKQALDIMKESKILKIEDVLPHITDTIKIEEFKKQISNCINEYEANIKKLKEDINDYNKTAENIKGDIYRVKKKSIEIQYSNCKCEICQGYIKDKNMFLFPCGHKFDMNCIKECLLNYEATGLDYIHNKNVEIDNLFYQLGFSKNRAFEEKKIIIKNKDNENENKKIEEGSKKIINKLKDLTAFKKQEIQEVKDPKQIQNLKDKLYDILSEQCVLCGDFMVDSIQCSLSQKDEYEPDKNGLRLIKFDEPDFAF